MFANVVAHSRRCRFRAYLGVKYLVFYVQCSMYGYRRFQAFSTVTAADRKWPSGLALRVSKCRNQLGNPRTVAIHRENTSLTPGTVAENFRFAVEMFGIDWANLKQRRSIDRHVRLTGNALGHHFRSTFANVEDGWLKLAGPVPGS